MNVKHLNQCQVNIRHPVTAEFLQSQQALFAVISLRMDILNMLKKHAHGATEGPGRHLLSLGSLGTPFACEHRAVLRHPDAPTAGRQKILLL